MGLLRKKGPDNDDLLIAVRGDGNVIFDRHVRQELGLLFSDANRWCMVWVEQVPIVKWVSRQFGPVKDGSAFAFGEEPPPPEHSSKVMNYLWVQMYRAFASGKTWKQNRDRRNKRMLQTAAAGVVIAAFFVAYVVVPVISPPEIVIQPTPAQMQEFQNGELPKRQ